MSYIGSLTRILRGVDASMLRTLMLQTNYWVRPPPAGQTTKDEIWRCKNDTPVTATHHLISKDSFIASTASTSRYYRSPPCSESFITSLCRLQISLRRPANSSMNSSFGCSYDLGIHIRREEQRVLSYANKIISVMILDDVAYSQLHFGLSNGWNVNSIKINGVGEIFSITHDW